MWSIITLQKEFFFAVLVFLNIFQGHINIGPLSGTPSTQKIAGRFFVVFFLKIANSVLLYWGTHKPPPLSLSSGPFEALKIQIKIQNQLSSRILASSSRLNILNETIKPPLPPTPPQNKSCKKKPLTLYTHCMLKSTYRSLPWILPCRKISGMPKKQLIAVQSPNTVTITVETLYIKLSFYKACKRRAIEPTHLSAKKEGELR